MQAFKFAHIADAHVGHGQWWGEIKRKRREDFGKAFLYAIDMMINHQVDFVVDAGDLTDKQAAPEWDRSFVREGLEKLKVQNIPYYAIRGNHNDADSVDGLSLLDEMEDMHLLQVPTGLLNTPASFEKNDIGVNIFGLPWSGSATQSLLSKPSDLLDTIIEFDHNCDYTILVAHCGLEGLMPQMYPETVPLETFYNMKPYIDYVALGHIHKPFDDGFIRMPGSLEVLNKGEVDYNSGINIVTVTIDDDGKATTEVEKVQVPRRPWVFLESNIGKFDTSKELTEDIVRHMKSSIVAVDGYDDDPIVVIELEGQRSFRVNRQAIRDGVMNSSAFVCQIDDNSVPAGVDIDVELTGKLASEIEIEFFEKNLGDDAGAALEIKRQVLLGLSGKKILESLDA